MEIKKNTSAAVVVRKSWANLYGVRCFIREGREIKESHDESHIILGKVLDADDPRGLWMETNTGRHETDPSITLQSILIPWREVLTIVLRQDLSPELWSEARRMGFVSGEIAETNAVSVC
jgi:hypothetical protein